MIITDCPRTIGAFRDWVLWIHRPARPPSLRFGVGALGSHLVGALA